MAFDRPTDKIEAIPLTPEQKAALAVQALESVPAYASSWTDGDKDTAISDLVADLMHLAAIEGFNFEEILQTATDNFMEEVKSWLKNSRI